MKKPLVETIKEAGRWILSAIAAWIITETLKQINLVPEVANVHVWVFTYGIPIRALLAFVLTLAGRGLDKYVFEINKLKDITKGIIPF